MHYTHMLQMCSWMWIKDGIHFKFYRRKYSELPSELPTVSILESRGLPTELPNELPTISIYGNSGQPHLNDQIPIGSPFCCSLSWPLFFKFQVVGCPLSFPLFPYMEIVSSLIFMTSPCFASQEFNNYTIAAPSYA